MVRDKWTNLIDGGINYGAPAHGGELEITTTEAIEDGNTVRSARFEIVHMDSTGYCKYQSIGVPLTELQPLIEHLQKLATEAY